MDGCSVGMINYQIIGYLSDTKAYRILKVRIRVSVGVEFRINIYIYICVYIYIPPFEASVKT